MKVNLKDSKLALHGGWQGDVLTPAIFNDFLKYFQNHFRGFRHWLK
jgi:hypothetical protein